MKKIILPILAMTINIATAQVNEKAYAKFDFVPGDKVMFDDNFQNEKSDEIPSHWLVNTGLVEVSKINNENVMNRTTLFQRFLIYVFISKFDVIHSVKIANLLSSDFPYNFHFLFFKLILTKFILKEIYCWEQISKWSIFNK